MDAIIPRCLAIMILLTFSHVKSHELHIFADYEFHGDVQSVTSDGECVKKFVYWPELKSIKASEGAICAIYNNALCYTNRCVGCIKDKGLMDATNRMTNRLGLAIRCVSAESVNHSCTCEEDYSGAGTIYICDLGLFVLLAFLMINAHSLFI